MTRPPAEITEALAPWMDRNGGIHVDEADDVPAFLDDVRRALAAAPAPASPDEPSTEAGRWLWDVSLGEHGPQPSEIRDGILAIEREARAASASVPPLDVEKAQWWLSDDDGCTCSGCVERRQRHKATLAAYAAETPEQDR